VVLHRTHHKPMAKMIGVTVRRERRWTPADAIPARKLVRSTRRQRISRPLAGSLSFQNNPFSTAAPVNVNNPIESLKLRATR
jgi:hypothetical protein